MSVRISEGNSKVGDTLNLSLPPVITCAKGVPCAKACYARKAYDQYSPDARRAWDANLKAYREDHIAFFGAINAVITKRKPAIFRWHVAGDAPDQQYVNGMKAVALLNPGTRFLAFTKQFGLDWSDLPDNLTVVFSMWPGMPCPDTPAPHAWMQDGTEFRIPTDATECPGNCEQCGLCWGLKAGHVVFHKH